MLEAAVPLFFRVGFAVKGA
jgi:hypothetical protein